MCLLTFLEQTEEGAAVVSSLAVTPSAATDSSDKAPVVKAKATHVIMNSLITSKHPWVSAEELKEEVLVPQLQLFSDLLLWGPTFAWLLNLIEEEDFCLLSISLASVEFCCCLIQTHFPRLTSMVT